MPIKNFEIFNEKVFFNKNNFVSVKPLTDEERLCFKSVGLHANSASDFTTSDSSSISDSYSTNFTKNRFLYHTSLGQISIFDLKNIKSANTVKPISTFNQNSLLKSSKSRKISENFKNSGLGNLQTSDTLLSGDFLTTITDENLMILSACHDSESLKLKNISNLNNLNFQRINTFINTKTTSIIAASNKNIYQLDHNTEKCSKIVANLNVNDNIAQMIPFEDSERCFSYMSLDCRNIISGIDLGIGDRLRFFFIDFFCLSSIFLIHTYNASASKSY